MADPTLGIETPDSAANRCGQGADQPLSTATMSRASAATDTVTAGPRTRPWPCRSTKRARGRAPTAVAPMYAADTPPAVLYDPVLPETSRTMPRLVIDSGSRASTPAALNARAPGTDSTWR